MFGLEEREDRTQRHLFRCVAEDRSLIYLGEMGKEFDTVCYLCTTKKKSIRVDGASVFKFDELPIEVQQKFNGDTSLKNQGELRYVKISCPAVDPLELIETAVKIIVSRKGESLLGTRGVAISEIDLHKNAVILRDGRYALLNWADYALSFSGLSLDRAAQNRNKRLVDTSDSLHAIVSRFRSASEAVQKRDTRTAFGELTEALDSLFEPVVSRSGRKYESRHLADYAAPFMAMIAPQTIFSYCSRKLAALTNSADSQAIKHIEIRNLRSFLQDHVPDSYQKQLLLNLATHVDIASGDLEQCRNSLVINATKYWFDFNHILCFRHSLVHKSKYLAEEYYLDELAEVFKGVISFRLSCIDAIEKVSDDLKISKVSTSIDDLFAVCLNMMHHDFEALVEGHGPLLWPVPAQLNRFARVGWGSWAACKLHETILVNKDKFNYFLREFRPNTNIYNSPDKVTFV